MSPERTRSAEQGGSADGTTSVSPGRAGDEVTVARCMVGLLDKRASRRIASEVSRRQAYGSLDHAIAIGRTEVVAAVPITSTGRHRPLAAARRATIVMSVVSDHRAKTGKEPSTGGALPWTATSETGPGWQNTGTPPSGATSRPSTPSTRPTPSWTT